MMSSFEIGHGDYLLWVDNELQDLREGFTCRGIES